MPIALGKSFPPATNDDVTAERDRRFATFPFAGKVIQSDADGRGNIAGAKSLADDAIREGAKEGDLGWQKLVPYLPAPADVFGWICYDNSVLPMDAFDVQRMAGAAVAHKQGLTFRARQIKERIEAGEIIQNVRDDTLWQ